MNEQAEGYFLDRVEEQYYEVLLKRMYRVFLKEVVPRNVGDRINSVLAKMPGQKEGQDIQEYINFVLKVVRMNNELALCQNGNVLNFPQAEYGLQFEPGRRHSKYSSSSVSR